MMIQCSRCLMDYESTDTNSTRLKVEIGVGIGGVSHNASYCPACAKKMNPLNHGKMTEQIFKAAQDNLFGTPGLSLNEYDVRDIAGNLGAGAKLTEALVEHVFGPDWTGKVPDAAQMKQFENRDRLVAFVVMRLKDLWTLES